MAAATVDCAGAAIKLGVHGGWLLQATKHN
jgi:hypothetical protein